MKTKILVIFIFLITHVSFGQVNGVVMDSISNQKIPYVNIWVENENIGTTSDENGKFTLNGVKNDKMIIFSAIGYSTKRVKYNQLKTIVKLQPQYTELEEVVITVSKKSNPLVLGGFNKSKVNQYFGCNSKPWIVARYFEKPKGNDKTHFLNKINILTNSDVKNSKFNIRLYSVNEKGEPDRYMNDKNIIGIAKKGKKETEVDISYLNIQFPENGIYVAIEWLIIESNKNEYEYTTSDSKERFQGISYEPAIGIVPGDTDKKSWVFNQGKWTNTFINQGSINSYKDKSLLLAIKLTLTD